MKLFRIIRGVDVSGVSGLGHIADGAVFDDGTTVIRWRTRHKSTAVYASFMEAVDIHGHNGNTIFQPVIDGSVEALCEATGYGNVMDTAARLWRAKDPVAAFSIGPCLAFTQKCTCKPGRGGCDKCHGCGWVFKKVVKK